MSMTRDEINAGESETLEFKEQLPDDHKKYIKTLVAFANQEGGLLVIGVRDNDRAIVGVPEDDVATMKDAIANAVRIPLSTSANQEYTVVIETQPSDQPETDTYGDSAVFGSAQAAIDQFNPVSAPIDADGETYTGVLVGSYLIIYTENFGDEAYYAYYFG